MYNLSRKKIQETEFYTLSQEYTVVFTAHKIVPKHRLIFQES